MGARKPAPTAFGVFERALELGMIKVTLYQ
jgi:hypothetical protein